MDVVYVYIKLTTTEKVHHKGIYHGSTVEKVQYTSPSCRRQLSMVNHGYHHI